MVFSILFSVIAIEDYFLIIGGCNTTFDGCSEPDHEDLPIEMCKFPKDCKDENCTLKCTELSHEAHLINHLENTPKLFKVSPDFCS